MRLTSILSVVALAGAATAAISKQTMANDMKEITDLASQANDAAQGMSPDNMDDTGPGVVNAFSDIIRLVRKSSATKGSNKRSVRTLVGGPSARNLEKRNSDLSETGNCPAFNSFVLGFNQLLNTIVEKDAMLKAAQLDQQVGELLRKMETYIDSLASALISLIPECTAATAEKKMLDASFSKALSAYQA